MRKTKYTVKPAAQFKKDYKLATKRGFRTERGGLNRKIGVTNKHLRQLKARISKLQNWLKKKPREKHLISGILH